VNTRAFVPFDGRILAEYYGGSTPGTLFDHPDNVGTVMASTSYNGTSCQDSLYYPYGEFWTGAGNCGMHQTFASLPDYDVETDQYNTANRHYSPMGRWMSPDPRNAGADPSEPQTWNMYAHVGNNPATFIDPTGLVGCYNGCNIPASGVTGAATGSPYGESSNSFGTTMGNDIFDAISGAPGTYLSFDPHGNMSFGFSSDLWGETQNYIDTTREQANPLIADLVPTTGYVVVEQDLGTGVETTGLIPDIEALAQARLQVANMMGYGDVYMGYINRFHASPEDVALQALAFSNTYNTAAQVLGNQFRNVVPYVNMINKQWTNLNLEQYGFLGFAPLLSY